MFEQVSESFQSVQAKSGEMVQQLSSKVSNTMGKGVTNAVSMSLQNWLNAHPLIHWVVDHPLWTVGLVVVTIFLFWGLLRAIARFIEQLWLIILRSPLLLFRWVLGISTRTYQRLAEPKDLLVPAPIDSQARLTEILTRLEVLRQEQDQLLQEVKTLLTVQG
ncbi:hypothetical protein OsccyDRAFT_0942 [Leptolyngbyaceae cyanobacterium JSC-12]|nr:hypothetical protein OsccyDRAFT_0942 [Leptolyngbyaceae cyanobacterium JSC-12]